MRKMYKDGKECMAATDQISAMEKAGWSVNPPVDTPVESADESAEETTGEDTEEVPEPEEVEKPKSAPKKKVAIKRPRKKIISED